MPQNEITQISNELTLLTDDRITTEILVYKNQVGQGIIEIGKRLIEMKKRIGHGGWLEYLKEKVDFNQATANKFMRIADEFGNQQALVNLGSHKLYLLLDVPAEERDEFIEQPHLINGVEKTVDEMTTRELQKVIREKEEAERLNSRYERQTENLMAMLEKKEETIHTIQFELDIERKKKLPEVVEKIVEKEVEVIPPSLKRDIEQKQLTIDNLTQSVVFNENEVRKYQSELARLKKENAELSKLKDKEQELLQFQEKLDKLKREQSSVVKQMEEEVKIFKSLAKVKEVIKDELLYIPTLTVHNSNTETMKREIKNLVELLDNLKYAFINKFGVQNG